MFVKGAGLHEEFGDSLIGLDGGEMEEFLNSPL